MTITTELHSAATWRDVATTEADWDAADPKLLGAMLTQLHLIRSFEETLLELAGEGLVHGPAHSSIGQEGGAVGSYLGLDGERRRCVDHSFRKSPDDQG